MKLAITGSNGYVGNFLSQYFSDKGIHVVGIDLASHKRQQTFLNFVFEKCDVRDEQRLKQIFVQHKITQVIHLAYLMEPQHNRKFEDDVDINGSIAVFRAADAVESVKQFIHFSSASIYGGWKNNQLWISEEHLSRPRDWVYAVNKKNVEELYYLFKKRKDFKLVNLRMCTAIGHSYFKKGGVVKALYSSPIMVLLDGCNTELQFIHEDDVKRIIELILYDKSVDGVFNLAPNSYSTTRELARTKLFVPFPKKLFKLIITILWNLRLIGVSPTSVNLIAHGIVVSPKKLIERYNYRFLHSTKSAYAETIRARLRDKTL